MRSTHEISCDGPYVHVFLPDVLPPDWEALRRELEPELEEGASRVTLIVGRSAGIQRTIHRCSNSSDRSDRPAWTPSSPTENEPTSTRDR